MLNLLKSKKSNRSRGFTLLELIVVLVILAILAALLLPALTKYIERTQKTAFEVKARMAVMAAQSVGSIYLSQDDPDVGYSDIKKMYMLSYHTGANVTETEKKMRQEIIDFAEIGDQKLFLANIDYDKNGKLIFLQMYSTASTASSPTVYNRIIYSNFTDSSGVVHSGFEIIRWNKEDFALVNQRDPYQLGIKY